MKTNLYVQQTNITAGCRTWVHRRSPHACGSLVIGIMAVCVLIASCSKKGELSTVADVCEMEDGTLVAVEGFLQLPNFLQAKTDPETEVTIYELFLAAQPDDQSPAVTTRISGTRGSRTNRIAELPVDGYTRRDLRIFTASGETVGSSDRVRVTGELWKQRSGAEQPCILKTETIEKP
jgi:hypothetical protein